MKSYREYVNEQYDYGKGEWNGVDKDYLDNIPTKYSLSDFESKFNAQLKKIDTLLKKIGYRATETPHKTSGAYPDTMMWEDEAGNEFWLSYYKDASYVASGKPFPKFSFISRLMFKIRGKNEILYNAMQILSRGSVQYSPTVNADIKRMYALQDYCKAAPSAKKTDFKIDMIAKEYETQIKELEKYISKLK